MADGNVIDAARLRDCESARISRLESWAARHLLSTEIVTVLSRRYYVDNVIGIRAVENSDRPSHEATMRQSLCVRNSNAEVGSLFKRPQVLRDFRFFVPSVAIMSAPNTLIDRAVLSLTAAIADRMKSLPGPPAEATDYRAWTEDFVTLVVRSDHYD